MKKPSYATPHVIYDTAISRRYIDVEYPSKLEAWLALRDLLHPYPPGHLWRERLQLREAALVATPVRVSVPRTAGGRRAA